MYVYVTLRSHVYHITEKGGTRTPRRTTHGSANNLQKLRTKYNSRTLWFFIYFVMCLNKKNKEFGYEAPGVKDFTHLHKYIAH